MPVEPGCKPPASYVVCNWIWNCILIEFNSQKWVRLIESGNKSIKELIMTLWEVHNFLFKSPNLTLHTYEIQKKFRNGFQILWHFQFIALGKCLAVARQNSQAVTAWLCGQKIIDYENESLFSLGYPFFQILLILFRESEKAIYFGYNKNGVGNIVYWSKCIGLEESLIHFPLNFHKRTRTIWGRQ